MTSALADDTLVTVESGGERCTVTWRDFAATNTELDEVGHATEDIARELAAGRSYAGGGGASPRWEVRLV